MFKLYNLNHNRERMIQYSLLISWNYLEVNSPPRPVLVTFICWPLPFVTTSLNFLEGSKGIWIKILHTFFFHENFYITTKWDINCHLLIHQDPRIYMLICSHIWLLAPLLRYHEFPLTSLLPHASNIVSKLLIIFFCIVS